MPTCFTFDACERFDTVAGRLASLVVAFLKGTTMHFSVLNRKCHLFAYSKTHSTMRLKSAILFDTKDMSSAKVGLLQIIEDIFVPKHESLIEDNRSFMNRR